MKNLDDFITESLLDISISKLDGFKFAGIDTEIFNNIDDAIKDWKNDTHKDIEKLTVDDVIDYFNPYNRYWVGKADDDKNTKWLEITYGQDAHPSAYILFGGAIFELDDIENFKHKNEHNTVLYIVLEEHTYCIYVKNLLEYLKKNKDNELVTQDKKSIKFNKVFLSKL